MKTIPQSIKSIVRQTISKLKHDKTSLSHIYNELKEFLDALEGNESLSSLDVDPAYGTIDLAKYIRKNFMKPLLQRDVTKKGSPFFKLATDLMKYGGREEPYNWMHYWVVSRSDFDVHLNKDKTAFASKDKAKDLLNPICLGLASITAYVLAGPSREDELDDSFGDYEMDFSDYYDENEILKYNSEHPNGEGREDSDSLKDISIPTRQDTEDDFDSY